MEPSDRRRSPAQQRLRLEPVEIDPHAQFLANHGLARRADRQVNLSSRFEQHFQQSHGIRGAGGARDAKHQRQGSGVMVGGRRHGGFHDARVAMDRVAIPNVSGTMSTRPKPAARMSEARDSPEGNASTLWFRYV